MLDDIFNETISKLKTINELNQIEPYEGQFDEIEEFLIAPPSCFIEIDSGTPGERRRSTDLTIRFYLITDHIKSNVPTSMLNLIDAIIEKFNKQSLAKLGRTDFSRFDRLAILPGFCAYSIDFQFKE